MPPALRQSSLRFGLQLIPLFLLSVWLYAVTLPRYAPIVVGAANWITDRMVPPTHIEIRPNGAWRSQVFTPWQGVEQMKTWPTPHFLLLSLAMVPALVLATPVRLSARLRMALLGLGAVFASHVLAAAGLTRGAYCLRVSPGNFACIWLLTFVYVSGQVLGVAIWALLTWRFWVARFRDRGQGLL